MVVSHRGFFIAGNWKMNPPTRAEAVALAEALKSAVGVSAEVRVAVCPASLHLAAIDAALDGSPIGLGAQNMHWEHGRAHTGELSGSMLADIGCTHVILGHSERRHGMGETDERISRKLHAALKIGLIPIVCVGETQHEREADKTFDIINGQLAGSLAGITDEQLAQTVIAYEPVWAIGTGLTATPEQAREVHHMIRARLSSQFDKAIAHRVVIQYGGSVKPSNAAELLAQPDIDGALSAAPASRRPTSWRSSTRRATSRKPKNNRATIPLPRIDPTPTARLSRSEQDSKRERFLHRLLNGVVDLNLDLHDPAGADPARKRRGSRRRVRRHGRFKRLRHPRGRRLHENHDLHRDPLVHPQHGVGLHHE